MNENVILRREHILLVDDEKRILTSFKRAFSDDFDVEVVDSAVKALELIQKKGEYAMIISDVMMPGIDGIVFIEEVKKISNASIRIMLTGLVNENTVKLAREKGDIFEYIAKPVNHKILKKIILNGLKRYHEQKVVAIDKMLENCWTED